MLKLLLMTTAYLFHNTDEGDGSGGTGSGASGGAGDDGKTNNPSMLDPAKIKGDAGQSDPNKAADDANKKPDDQKPTDLPGQKGARPDWLKEDKFWDAEKGEVKTQDILKGYRELEKKFTNGDHKAPDSPEKYKINLNDDQKKTLFGDAKADPMGDEGIKSLTAWGAKNKVSQEALNELLGEYVKIVEPEMQKITIDIEAEKATLGKNADAIITESMNFLGHLYKSGHINDKHLAELQILGETAAGIQALQKIREYYGEKPIPTNMLSSDSGMPTKQELSAMLNDPKYDNDPDYKARVDALYAKMYGNQPAMSSAQNR